MILNVDLKHTIIHLVKLMMKSIQFFRSGALFNHLVAVIKIESTVKCYKVYNGLHYW